MVVVFLMISTQFIVRKIFKIEKKKSSLSYNFVNETHKKVDLSLRFVGLISLIAFNMYSYENGYTFTHFTVGLLLFLIILDLENAYFHWKFAHESKQYFLILSGTAMVIIIYILLLPVGLMERFFL
ncbi:hypothetical protein JOC95_002887 [Bacillus tianshenii]|uniref:DUF4181 domain-containing protein n=2 Tax=Sutcliffiella tianshenii TaxID=1463404 RepID=A0ABS2P233_9BACI|nr:hypothetical protein [Bacillus tianshenii]